MKHLKEFKSIKDDEPQIGDYVICHENSHSPNSMLNTYLSENIGKILYKRYADLAKNTILFSKKTTDTNIYLYDAQYDYNTIPKNLYNKFVSEDHNIMSFYKEEILHYSSNKKDLELIIDANKYNL